MRLQYTYELCILADVNAYNASHDGANAVAS